MLSQRTCIITASTLALSSLSYRAHAYYIEPKKVLSVSTDTSWLIDGAKEGVKAGAESLGKEMLTNVGQALLASYSPQLAAIVFGESDSLEQHTKRIVEEIRANHDDLADRNRDLLDEVMQQFHSDVIGGIKSGGDTLSTFLGNGDLLTRINSKGSIEHLPQHFDDIRSTLESYTRAAVENKRLRFRRLELLPFHITAAQLAITASEHYQATVAIETAFQRTGLAQAKFDHWLQSLTPEAVAQIEASSEGLHVFRDQVMEEVLAFYAALAEEDAIADYRDDIFTPLVSHMVVFDRDQANGTGRFDVGDVMNDPKNWTTRPGPVAVLDGLRWYYYVNIPRNPGGECLMDEAYIALTDTSHVPWTEVAGKPAESPCNRFWVLDPNLQSSKPDPGQYLASMDGYSSWFNDGEDIYDVHREFIHGDLVRVVYGPVKLVLDRFHAELHGGTRSLNNWDHVLDEYERLVGLLGAGPSYDAAVTSDADLRSFAATAARLGIADWYRMLTKSVSARDRARDALQMVRTAHDAVDYMAVKNAPLSPAELRYAMLDEKSVFDLYDDFGWLPGSPGIVYSVVARKAREGAAAKLVAVLP